MDWQQVGTMVGVIFGPAGAAWIAVKVTLNGAREDIREIKEDVKGMRSKVDNHGERLASLEGSLGK